VIFVFDSSPLIDLFKHYYPERFPTLWKRFDDLLHSGNIVSVKEVYNELKTGNDRLATWTKANRKYFHEPSIEELQFVTQIFGIAHFRSLIREQERLQGKPVADPFVIARAHACSGCVVTNEVLKPQASKIPNVCERFHVKCTNLEGFMKEENWQF
jgi:hypothetical protein